MKTPNTGPISVRRTKVAWSTAAVLLVLTGCSASPESARHAPPDRESRENTGAAESAVVSGATNVSNGITPDSTWQGETAAAGIGPYQMVAYNADDTAHTNPGDHRCQNYSEIAFSYNSDNTWRSLHVPVPSNLGISLLRGDPGLSVIDSGSMSVFVVSSMAVTTATWGILSKLSDGCVSKTSFVNALINNLCYTAVVVPHDQSPAFFYGSACVHPSVATDDIDGTSVYVDTQNGQLNVYAAYANSTHWAPDPLHTGTIEAFKNGTALPNPFPGKNIFGHPRFIQHAGNVPTIVAPDWSGTFWVSRLNEATSTWTVTALTSSRDPLYAWDATAKLGDGTTIATGMYSGDVYNTGLVDNLVFFYPTFARAGSSGPWKSVQEGVSCVFVGTSGSCSRQPAWTTSLATNAIFSSVAVANVSNSTFYPAVTYWSDTATGGTLTLQVGTITASTAAFSVSATTLSQKPCVFGGSYWGDYDGMAIFGNGTSLPLLVRYFSDSTGGTCLSDGTPQHVSVYTGLP